MHKKSELNPVLFEITTAISVHLFNNKIMKIFTQKIMTIESIVAN